MYSFPLGEEETVVKKGHGSFHSGHDAWSGAFYLTNERLVFVGYAMDIRTKYMDEIHLTDVTEVKGGKTFFLIPNVLDITANRDRKWKVIVEGRGAWLTAIQDELAKQG
ncbi:MAG: hypothetical protein P4N59_17335 [Negativicutes bacterium]|nr:hypothetical protein [Negativicutes bacterium]